MSPSRRSLYTISSGDESLTTTCDINQEFRVDHWVEGERSKIVTREVRFLVLLVAACDYVMRVLGSNCGSVWSCHQNSRLTMCCSLTDISRGALYMSITSFAPVSKCIAVHCSALPGAKGGGRDGGRLQKQHPHVHHANACTRSRTKATVRNPDWDVGSQAIDHPLLLIDGITGQSETATPRTTAILQKTRYKRGEYLSLACLSHFQWPQSPHALTWIPN